MRVAFGLGNPGLEYADTRHNAGFLLADALAARWKLPRFKPQHGDRAARGRVGTEPVAVVKPQTYMNESGAALAPYLAHRDFDPARDLLVLADDFALPLGQFRLRARGSAGGHNGLESIEAVLGSRDYARLRIGVGPLPEGTGGEDWADFVLAPFEPGEREAIDALLPVLAEAAECWVVEGIATAMNRYNRRGRSGE